MDPTVVATIVYYNDQNFKKRTEIVSVQSIYIIYTLTKALTVSDIQAIALL